MLGGAVAAYVKRLQGWVGEQEKALGKFKPYVTGHYASQKFLNGLKREIADSLRDLGGRIDHVFHHNRDRCHTTFQVRAPRIRLLFQGVTSCVGEPPSVSVRSGIVVWFARHVRIPIVAVPNPVRISRAATVTLIPCPRFCRDESCAEHHSGRKCNKCLPKHGSSSELRDGSRLKSKLTRSLRSLIWINGNSKFQEMTTDPDLALIPPLDRSGRRAPHWSFRSARLLPRAVGGDVVGQSNSSRVAVTDQDKAALRSPFELKDVSRAIPTELYFGPRAPTGQEDRWIKTIPGKGWFTYFRVYGPQDLAFDGSWRSGDFERV